MTPSAGFIQTPQIQHSASGGQANNSESKRYQLQCFGRSISIRDAVSLTVAVSVAVSVAGSVALSSVGQSVVESVSRSVAQSVCGDAGHGVGGLALAAGFSTDVAATVAQSVCGDAGCAVGCFVAGLATGAAGGVAGFVAGRAAEYLSDNSRTPTNSPVALTQDTGHDSKKTNDLTPPAADELMLE